MTLRSSGKGDGEVCHGSNHGVVGGEQGRGDSVHYNGINLGVLHEFR